VIVLSRPGEKMTSPLSRLDEKNGRKGNKKLAPKKSSYRYRPVPEELERGDGKTPLYILSDSLKRRRPVRPLAFALSWVLEICVSSPTQGIRGPLLSASGLRRGGRSLCSRFAWRPSAAGVQPKEPGSGLGPPVVG